MMDWSIIRCVQCADGSIYRLSFAHSSVLLDVGWQHTPVGHATGIL